MALSTQLLLRRGDFTLDASLRVEAGETLALLGPNGSGKSTLLAAIAGLLVPERGVVEVNGRTLTSLGSADAGSAGTGPAGVEFTNVGSAVAGPASAGPASAGPAGAGPAGAGPAGAGPAGAGPIGAGFASLGAASLGSASVGSAGAGSVSARPRGRTRVVAPHERRIGLLGQDPLLFPHLTALENVAFGARARGESAARARASASGWLEAVGLAGFASRRPGQLSGGQQQRVAIARALAAEPEVLLLDEPMAALDVQNASAVRTLLRERLRATALPTIVVSHDVVDALVLADRVAIMDNGRIIDIGEPAMVLGRPINRFSANLVGLNVLQGTLDCDGTVLASDGRRLRGTIAEDGVDVGVGADAGPGAGVAAGAGAGTRDGASAGAGSGAGTGTLRAGDSVMAAFPPSALRVTLTAPDVLCVLEAPDGPDGLQAEGAVGRTDETGSADETGSTGETGSADVTPSVPGANSWRATVGVLEPAARGIRIPFVGDDCVAEATTAELLATRVYEGAAVTVTVEPKFVTVYRARRATGAMQG